MLKLQETFRHTSRKGGNAPMIIFYVRCSTAEQNETRQLEVARLHKANKIFIDKASGKNKDRPQLAAMLAFAREGDTVVCSDISRIARNTRDLLFIIDELQRKGVAFMSLKESIDTATPQGQFMLTVFGALAQLERDCIRQRAKEGMLIAKQEGRLKGRPQIDTDEKNFRAVCTLWRAGKITAVQAQQRLNMSPSTFYRRVKTLGV